MIILFSIKCDTSLESQDQRDLEPGDYNNDDINDAIDDDNDNNKTTMTKIIHLPSIKCDT